jgi:uncharacterized membrane protein
VSAFVQRATTLGYPPHMYYQELWYESPRWAIVIPPILLVLLLVFARLRATPDRAVPPFFLLMVVAGALASALNHSTQWAYANCFIPLAMTGSLYTALALATWTQSRGTHARAAALSVIAALIVQLGALAYDPVAQVPNRRDLEAYRELERTVASLPGEVFMPAHPFFVYEHGGPILVHQMGIGDVAFAGGLAELQTRLARREFEWVILDEMCDIEGLRLHYRPAGRVRYSSRQALRTRTGFATRPISIYRASPQRPPPP